MSKINFKRIKIGPFAAILSLLTLVLFHGPFFKYVVGQVEEGFNGVLIIVGLAFLFLILNYIVFYMLLFLGRIVGRIILAFFFIGNSVSLYFINTYDVMLDDTMMGNVFNTQYSEASGFFSFSAVLYLVLMGILPAAYVLCRKIEFGTAKQMFARFGITIGVSAVVGFANMPNWPWIDKNAPVIGSLILPWSYTVNSIRYHNEQKERNRTEILLPDATIANDDKELVVLVIGESARRDHFSLYGYERETNPVLSKLDGLKFWPADASATYTTAGVKAILDHKPVGELYEILPNYLFRNGADVIWRTSNWGEPPLHIEKVVQSTDLSEASGIKEEYDEVLLYKLKEQIEESDKAKLLVVLHTSTSHGPSYNKRYPAEFEKFTPVCESVEMSKIPQDQLINAYDNSILYTDNILGRVVEILKAVPERKSCMIYVSDHGESLGEGNLYMHGVPVKFAPKEQIEIPFIVWSSDPDQKYVDAETVSQYNVFHSILNFLHIDSPVYDKDMNIFQ